MLDWKIISFNMQFLKFAWAEQFFGGKFSVAKCPSCHQPLPVSNQGSIPLWSDVFFLGRLGMKDICV